MNNETFTERDVLGARIDGEVIGRTTARAYMLNALLDNGLRYEEYFSAAINREESAVSTIKSELGLYLNSDLASPAFLRFSLESRESLLFVLRDAAARISAIESREQEDTE